MNANEEYEDDAETAYSFMTYYLSLLGMFIAMLVFTGLMCSIQKEKSEGWGRVHGTRAMEEQAVERGFGEYYRHEVGIRMFRWKSPEAHP